MIPFRKDFVFEYAKPHAVSPLIRRVVARNGGRFTGPGTGTLIVGHGTVAIVDPGPDRDDHFEALQAALTNERVSHVFVTHQHIDHSPLGRRLADAYGALLCGSVGATTDEHGGAVREEAGDDDWFAPDVELHDNWRAQGENWTLRALHTPGHTATHYCFALEEENALFCGDHIMAWSTSIVSPPHGHMGDYFASLARTRDARFDRLIPTHGAAIDDPGPFIDAYIAHRLKRERDIAAAVRSGVSRARDIVEALYGDVDRALHPAAMHSVWAHLIHLAEQGIVAADPAPTLDAHYRPTKKRQEA
ncbi:MAG: MBL fold metallo-hydrolase [Hyphomonadaceae bacterium]|nr:MBL fold metallo-hydrolase [Hyphomonadaceae bacterium]